MVRKAKGQKFIESVYPHEPDAWERYCNFTVKFNQDVRQLCLQHLAERHAGHRLITWFTHIESIHCDKIVASLVWARESV